MRNEEIYGSRSADGRYLYAVHGKLLHKALSKCMWNYLSYEFLISAAPDDTGRGMPIPLPAYLNEPDVIYCKTKVKRRYMMGIFSKFVKSKWDCSERPIEWYSDPAQKEVFEHYVTQSKVEDFIEYVNKISRTGKDYQDLLVCTVTKGDLMRPWLDPLYYFYYLLSNHKGTLFACDWYVGGEKLDAQQLLKRAAHNEMIKFTTVFALELLVKSNDERGDAPPLKYPDIIKQEKNPILNYLIRMEAFWMEIVTKKYKGKWGFRSYMKASKNVLRISFAMLGYLYASYFADGRNESDSEWIYDESLYLLPGKDGVDGYPEARSYQNVCAQMRKNVADSERWDKVLEKLSSELEYMDSMDE